ncbi:ROK family protein [Teredinibacter haidensis]|uniref:ROK family protein n=1 Tax=Teredinibacter haidensis TaxID=2731755 RepID=UPI000948AE1B|nr:ROK family protein [Teredinibacter haidensis]
MTRLYGAIEAGGTKFVCAVGTGPEDIKDIRFPTTTPQQTLQRAVDFFLPYRQQLAAIGVGSFGPIDLHRDSPSYGCITSTPKPGWANTSVVGALGAHFDIPIGFDTDVNGAALGEAKWGAAQGLDDFIYLTIGTGIGGGVVSGGQLVHGLVHPELGHSFLPKLPEDGYKGRCPYHGDSCFEGLAAGPAIEERWQVPGAELAADHPAWNMEAEYIALALASYFCTLSPQRIILGGGVMDQSHLISMVREKVQKRLNGYIQHSAILDDIENTIVLPGLGSKAGILGAMVLAQQLEG